MIFHARHIPFFILWVRICEYMDWLGRQFRVAYTPMENEMKMCTESIRDFSTESENSAPSMKDEYDEYTQKNLTNETRNGEKKISLQISSVIDEREREKLVPQKKGAYFFWRREWHFTRRQMYEFYFYYYDAFCSCVVLFLSPSSSLSSSSPSSSTRQWSAIFLTCLYFSVVLVLLPAQWQ